jgi:hypothetical protein
MRFDFMKDHTFMEDENQLQGELHELVENAFWFVLLSLYTGYIKKL